MAYQTNYLVKKAYSDLCSLPDFDCAPKKLVTPNSKKRFSRDIQQSTLLIWNALALIATLALIQPAALAKNRAEDTGVATMKVEPRVKTAIPASLAINRVSKIHGLAFYPEYPERFVDKGITKKGWGARFFAPSGTTNWFHASIPIVADGSTAKLTLQSISLLFFASNSTVQEVQLWDGSTKIGAFTKLNLTGDHTATVSAANRFELPKGIEINHGLSISIGVGFANPDNPQNNAGLTLISATAEYKVHQ